MLADGTFFKNALATLARVFIGLGISFAVAVPLGVLMARYWVAERIFLPVLSVLLPIPSLAWVPLFILWFGLGEIIFNAAEFLDAGTMLATLVGIGVIGVIFERLVFQTLEQATVRRWG